MTVFARPTPVHRRLSDRQQSHGWLNHADRDLAGINPIFTTTDISGSRLSHISRLVPLGDEFSGFVVLALFRDFS